MHLKSIPSSPLILPVLFLLTWVSTTWAQLADPLPEEIEMGSLVLELEDWVTIPASSGGTPRARISIFRALADGRIFVNDLRGRLYRIENRTPSVYLDLAARLANFMDAPGLGTGFHSFAFHPGFSSNGKLYTVHSEPWNAATADFKGPTAPVESGGQQSVLTEWTTGDPSAGTFSGSHRELLRIYFPGNIHAMQEIAFNPNAQPGSPDYGMLYVCNGEGGSYLQGYANNEHRLDSPMGTIFRIDPLGSNSDNGAYGIPADNPWANAANDSILKEIYAYGFRNPHRITWDTGGSGRVYVGDIGETQIEEVNLLQAGGDYGFPEREGTFLLEPDEPQNNTEVFPLPNNDEGFGYTYPVAQYDHDEGIAVVLGPVYRGSLASSALDGYLLFGDIAWGRVFAVLESELALGKQATITEVQLELDGVGGDLRSFVGNNRADLRWGRDADGEIYLMTKTDGKIRKVVGARFHEKGAILQDRERWQLAEDFEEGQGALVVVYGGTNGTVEVVPDPYGGSENSVLRLNASSAYARLPIALTAGGNEGEGSVYFRFALAGGGAANFGISRHQIPLAAHQASFSLNASASEGMTVYDGATSANVSSSLRTGIWYEVWGLFSQSDGTFNLYVRGGEWTAPALLRSGLEPRDSMGSGLRTFLIALMNNLPAGAAIYLDDVYVDSTALNLAAPVGAQWSLIADFETDSILHDWTFEPAAGFATRSIEVSGNHYLKIKPISDQSMKSLGLISLPRPVEVSETATLYGRARVDALALRQVFGLANGSSDDFFGAPHVWLEASLGFPTEAADGVVRIRDDQVFEATSATVAPGQWYDFWMVVRNGGEASGGQTYDFYWRQGGSLSDPSLLYEDAGFQVARESPLTSFGLVAESAQAGGQSGSLWLDDLYLTDGMVLERPYGTGTGMFPGPRGGKQIPWLGNVWDVHSPWIHHEGHSWIYVVRPENSASWAYEEQVEWFWLSPVTYPWIYVQSRNAWLYYLENSRNPRWFYDAKTQEWISIAR
jgi:hypothetical protein